MSKEIIATTKPNEEGELLWCVKYESSYYDNDDRMPGSVPIDMCCYVLAKNYQEAIKKAEPDIKQARKRKDKGADEDISAAPVTLENLIPCRSTSKDGRLGFHPTSHQAPIKLANVDANRYRLGVCLIPIDEK